MLLFWCQKKSLSSSIPLSLEVLYMEQSDEDILKYFLLKMCAHGIMTLLIPVHFIFIPENLTQGFALKKNFSGYSFVEAPYTTRFR